MTVVSPLLYLLEQPSLYTQLGIFRTFRAELATPIRRKRWREIVLSPINHK